MRCLATFVKILIVLGLFYIIFPGKAYAYINPGINSYFLQLFWAIFLGALFTIKLFWRSLKDFFLRISSKFKK